MDESAARDVLLVRAIETTDADGTVLSADDRRHAGRAAAELAHWGAAEARTAPTPERFLAQRARLLLERLGSRQRAHARAAQALQWRPWIDVALPALALAAGVAFERLGDGGRVNVLAFPLLALLLWNLAIYLLIGVGWTARAAGRPLTAARGPRALLHWVALRAAPRATAATATAITRFTQDWLALAAPLHAARIARVLHLSAALFALGAIAGLYLRGLVFDYRAGWESTFLDPPAVHALLSTVLGPAASLLGQTFPSVEALAAIRFPASAGESAARWIHWYALTVAALVLLPRLLLAAAAAFTAQRLARALPLDLSAPYFRRLLADIDATPARLRVQPFSYTLDEDQVSALRRIGVQLFGERCELLLRPSIAYGSESSAAQPPDAQAAPVALTLALCNLAATPEQENHGAFLDALQVATRSPRALLVDAGPYARRLGPAAGTARLDERRAAWRAFAQARGWTVCITDLAAPDLAQIERDLAPVLGALTEPR
jgi:hypothetical protein